MTRVLVTGGAGFIGSNLVAGAARARGRRPRARQLLDGQPREPRGARARGRGRRGRPPLVRARPHGRARRRGRLPPGRARLGAALGAGPAHVDGGQRRGHAQRPARRARRGHPPRRGGVVVVRLRRRRDVPARRDAGARPASRPTPSRSSPPSGSASRFTRVYGIETVALRYFNVFGPRQDPTSQYAAVVPRFIERDRRGPAASRSTATASSRATSRTSRTSSPRTCSRRTRAGPRAASSTSRPAARRRSTRSRTRSAGCSAGRSRRRTARRSPATCESRGRT